MLYKYGYRSEPSLTNVRVRNTMLLIPKSTNCDARKLNVLYN